MAPEAGGVELLVAAVVAVEEEAGADEEGEADGEGAADGAVVEGEDVLEGDAEGGYGELDDDGGAHLVAGLEDDGAGVFNAVGEDGDEEDEGDEEGVFVAGAGPEVEEAAAEEDEAGEDEQQQGGLEASGGDEQVGDAPGGVSVGVGGCQSGDFGQQHAGDGVGQCEIHLLEHDGGGEDGHGYGA